MDPAQPIASPVPTRSKRRRLMTTGAVLVVLGLIVSIGGIVPGVLSMVRSMTAGEQFGAPGEHTLRIDQPGEHIIWHERSGVFQGQVHSSRGMPAGMQIEVFDERGQSIPLRSRTAGTVTIGSTERRSIAAFGAPVAGEYRIRAEGSDQPAVLFVGPEVFLAMFGTISLLACIGFVGMLLIVGGIIIIIVGALTPVQPVAQG